MEEDIQFEYEVTKESNGCYILSFNANCLKCTNEVSVTSYTLTHDDSYCETSFGTDSVTSYGDIQYTDNGTYSKSAGTIEIQTRWDDTTSQYHDYEFYGYFTFIVSVDGIDYTITTEKYVFTIRIMYFVQA